jgi:4-hydroxyphenylpyruvate dioxygenase-like putative hemolysin
MEKWVEVNPGQAGTEYLYVATFLPVKKWKDIIPFLRMSLRIERQVKRSPGLMGYGLRAHVLQKRFWTLSVWNQASQIGVFVRSEPHATAVARFVQWAGPGAAFVQWKAAGVRPAWKDAVERLKTPTFYYHAPGSPGA